MNAKPIVAALTAALFLAACATIESPTWRHSSGINSPAQLNADHSACSAQVAHMPSPSPISPQRSTTSTFQGTTASGTTFSGTAQTQPSGGFSSGFAAGMAARQAKDARDAAFRTCMAQRGWASH